MEERVQKILARAGFGSRRSCETFIQAGRVTVNGKTAILGTKADLSRDEIKVDNKPLLKIEPKKVYIALHKPRGILSDFDPADPRPSVLSMVPDGGHLFAVGRLDLDSEGLILLTNDGELVSRMPDEEQLTIWRRGVVLEDGHKTAPARVSVESKAGETCWLQVILREGRKRQIREVGARIGLPVKRIIRLRIGTLSLGKLKPGEWRYLKSGEIETLSNSVKNDKKQLPK
jgi:23S rRNA pseudouridine2605 synthase